jgi:hypothetical protein
MDESSPKLRKKYNVGRSTMATQFDPLAAPKRVTLTHLED